VLQVLRAGFQPSDLDGVFVTHHHFDHIGDLDDVILSSWISMRTDPLLILGPQGTTEIVTALLGTIYRRDIAFRCAEAAATGFTGLLDPKELVDVRDVDSGLIFEGPECRVYAERVEHGSVLNLPEWTCMGYRVEAEGKIVAFSGDTVPCEGVQRLAKDADVLVQCCYLLESARKDPAADFCARHVLASSGQVGKIARASGVRRLVLTHFGAEISDMQEKIERDVRQSFAGEIVLGQDLLVLDI
jgi:ribonuclease Z